MVTKFFEYSLTLNAPALVSTVEGDPNSVLTSSFLPGSAIRGAVASALSPAHLQFADIVLSGAVRFLNAYPSVPRNDGRVRAVPAPRSWRSNKIKDGEVYDFASSGQTPTDVQFAAPKTPFFTLEEQPEGARPDVRRHFHQARDRERGRPTEHEGAIFVYEALERGTVLHGIVAIHGTEQEIRPRLDLLKQHLRSVRIGRSKLTEYGAEAVVKWNGAERDREDGVAARLPASIPRGTHFRAFLTSDAIVRDEGTEGTEGTGQIDPGAIDAELQRKLKVKVVARFVASVVVGGFNVKWRLPLPQAPAVAAGSVLILEAIEDIRRDSLDALENFGIGERRSEGFGCILFLPSTNDAKVSCVLPGPHASPKEARPDGTLPAWAMAIQNRLLRRAVERCVEDYALSLVRKAPESGFPSRALIGRFRAALRTGTPADPLAGVRALLEGRNAIKTRARDQLQGYHIRSGTSLDEWLTSACQPGWFAAELRDHGLESFTLDGQVAEETLTALARSAAPESIDAVLALLGKKSRTKEGVNHG